MVGTKFLKAVCKKTGRAFGIEVKQTGGVWKAVNFIPLTADEAAVMTSEIRQAAFSSADNLLSCSKCGKRTVGGCSCAPKKFDCRHGGYNFQCLYCDQLTVDYSAPTAGHGYKEGDVIRLSQGQEVCIQRADKPLTKICVGVGWDPARQGDNMDIDSSVIVAGQKAKEIVYFGALTHSSGCVVHHGDNLTGEGDGNDDDENIDVFLDKVPADRDRLIFVLNIYNCKERRQHLGDVKNMYIRLYDPVSRRALIEYRVESNMKNDTAVVIGTAYREGGVWKFRAVGRGSRAENVQQLADEAVRMR